MKKILNQAIHFFLISGIGWCLDFSTYLLLTYIFDFKVSYANMISSIPAVTYVFIVSTRKIFQQSNSKISLKYKYLIYIAYQIIMVYSISMFGNFLYNLFVQTNIVNISFIYNYLKLIIKIMITPITMIVNFIVMKNLIEKI